MDVYKEACVPDARPYDNRHMRAAVSRLETQKGHST